MPGTAQQVSTSAASSARTEPKRLSPSRAMSSAGRPPLPVPSTMASNSASASGQAPSLKQPLARTVGKMG